jgi:poly [ADP-ribose] polymerase
VPDVLEVFELDREGENSRFRAHDADANRRLLWHGTDIATVAAISASGLRIMPSAGGRVGAGIYMATECGKSGYYVRPAADGTGIMFLGETSLGAEHHISQV